MPKQLAQPMEKVDMMSLQGSFKYLGQAALLPFSKITARFDFTLASDRGPAMRSHAGADAPSAHYGPSLVIALTDARYLLPLSLDHLRAATQHDPVPIDAPQTLMYMTTGSATTQHIDVEAMTVAVAVTYLDGGRVIDHGRPFKALALPVKARAEQLASTGAQAVLVNRETYDALAASIAGQDGISVAYLLPLLAQLVDATASPPHLTLTDKDKLVAVLERMQVPSPERVVELIQKFARSLFEFPLELREQKRVKIAGDISLLPQDGSAVKLQDMLRYRLEMAYAYAQPSGQPGQEAVAYDLVQHQSDFDGTLFPFSFGNQTPILAGMVDGTLAIELKNFDKTVVWRQVFQPDDPALEDVHIVVPLNRPTALTASSSEDRSDAGKRLRGQVLQVGSTCELKGARIIIQAKQEAEGPWRVVTAGTLDTGGNFSLPYPRGHCVQAQALVSLSPDTPAPIALVTDGDAQVIAEDFLYLMIDLPDCGPQHEHEGEEDCGCDETKKAGRLPTQADLINSDQYTQDIGGSCINLTTPNRTLREYQYSAVVRTSDPDVCNYTLIKGTDGAFTLKAAATKIARGSVDLDNPIRWQDAPDARQDLSFYQSVTVASGHILHYRSEFKADGYSLGDLLYSLGLAPGQQKQMVVIENRHSLLGAETQSSSQKEALVANLSNDRSIVDQISGGIAEDMRGQSSASTSGVSAGLGASASFGGIGGSLGVAGGYSNATSSASQDSSRNVSQYFSEHLRQNIMQNADSYRQLNATVVTSVQEGQKYAATTEVVANHNHCHSLTMMYFEVLRHYAIYQELVDVEECVFVPLLMTNFDTQNIYKWSDVLARSLLPMHANTYLKPFSHFIGAPRHPLLGAFDANERIKTAYAHVDFPSGTYDAETIQFVKGYMDLRTNLERPKTRYDRILSLPVVSKTVTQTVSDTRSNLKAGMLAVMTGGLSFLFGEDGTDTVEVQVLTRAKIFDSFMTLDANYETVPPARSIRVVNFRPITVTVVGGSVVVTPMDFFQNDVIDKRRWDAYASVLGYSDTLSMLENYFQGRLISEWDEIYYGQIAPVLFEKIVDSIGIDVLSLDMSTTSSYRGGERMMRVEFSGTTAKARRDILYMVMSSNSPVIKSLKGLVTLTVQNLRISYSTAHFNGYLYAGNVSGDLLDDQTLYAPETPDETKDPRKEDQYLVHKLIEHLNSNLEHYNKSLWRNLDPDRRYMLLDGFNIQVYDDLGIPTVFRSLASIVKNRVMAIAGNSLVMPVAPGYRVNQSFIVDNTGEDNGESQTRRVTLLDHYQPLTPVPPYRVSVPTHGVFLEAIQGSCDACERVKENSSQDWTRFTTDQPTAISPVTPVTPTITDWKASFKDFAPPMISIQNAPAAPAPGAGLAGLDELLGKSGIFKDITGLDANQQNAIKTYLSNQENAKAFAEMAKSMVMQGHNTENSGKIVDTMNQAKDAGGLSQDDYKKLMKDHIQQQIDGGDTKRAELQMQKAAQKPTLVDAAIKAADAGRGVKAESLDADGNSAAITLSGDPQTKAVLAAITGILDPIQQPNPNACWATAATMMVNWKMQASHSVQDVMTLAGPVYLAKLNAGQGLLATEKDAFLATLQLTSEGPADYPPKQYIDWLKQYGPLWITTDARAEEDKFSPHARILFRIEGTDSPDGAGMRFVFIDPAKGSQSSEPFEEFIAAFEAMASDNTGKLFPQVVHFPATASGGEGYQIEGPWNIHEPIHETITLAALMHSTVAAPSTTRINSDKAINEFFRGVMWNDDPAVLMFNENKTDNWDFSGGFTWLNRFNTGKKASSNDLKNLTGRSHFWDLQFLHAMGAAPGEDPKDTRAKILMWVECMYRLAVGDGISKADLLKSVPVSTTFGSTTYTLGSFFTAATDPLESATLETLLDRDTKCVHLDLSRRAIGSVLHIVQDSYAKGHTHRALKNPVDLVAGSSDTFAAGKFGDWGEVENFHCYKGQNEKQHDKYDVFNASNLNASVLTTFDPIIGARNAIDASVKVLDFWKAKAAYAAGPKALFEDAIFKLSATATPSDTSV